MPLSEYEYERLLRISIRWDEKMQENTSKIINDLFMFGKSQWDQQGNHVPLDIPDGECEICKNEHKDS
jgi:hypothetical protein